MRHHPCGVAPWLPGRERGNPLELAHNQVYKWTAAPAPNSLSICNMFRALNVAIAWSLLIGVAFAQTGTPTQLSPSASSAAVSASAAAATASTSSETSNVQGLWFDSLYIIWLENTVRDDL